MATSPLPEKAEQILRAAVPEFLAHGYARTSMDRVAKVAGVSKQTLYSHFSDKDGLFTALVERIAIEEFQLVWAKPLQGEPETVLRDLARRILTEHIGDTDYLRFCRLIFGESEVRPDLAQIFLKNLVQPAVNVVSDYFKTRPDLNSSDPEATARIFVGSLIHWLMVQEALYGKEVMPMDPERIVESLITLIVPRA
ncbi:TetR/AcrR family transcriptional regulator [Oscillatoria sp. FACHB-1406]|uniref:TetR/AcrR family transcriptional regulator n=1 Tax=Oscillatoria sp. FACHB-1406 TaxID=2692846 RepID=UPI0016823DA5|nr:TetR/AcrR family transcriptional regulator [Oscillatoria sp. FACHB-1406]MBD2576331.1 TetR/AcrR family transcriptional regulator [Oscillatoria sp. FACHB-1406]